MSVFYSIPKGVKQPRPAIVCLHGHDGVYPVSGRRTQTGRTAPTRHPLIRQVFCRTRLRHGVADHPRLERDGGLSG